MSENHTIRLRGPWEFEPVSGELPKAGRVQLPCDWDTAFGDYRGRIRLRRRFASPTGLGQGQTVWLVIASSLPPQNVAINGQPLLEIPEGDKLRLEITSRLAVRNELTFELVRPVDAEKPGSFVEVCLEIHSQ